LYKTLTLMLFNLINLPNLMGARRSCGQFRFSCETSRCSFGGKNYTTVSNSIDFFPFPKNPG
jgi:hypothetical protein